MLDHEFRHRSRGGEEREKSLKVERNTSSSYGFQRQLTQQLTPLPPPLPHTYQPIHKMVSYLRPPRCKTLPNTDIPFHRRRSPATQSDDWDKQTVLRGGQKRVATVTKSESAVNNARRMGIAVSTESKGPAGSNSRGGRELRFGL
jgi:hypothetical protein